ncbi:cell wall hydrolase [Clostridium botulinum]|nr:cell wall hydrolase [Clostridium botulinum]
MRKKEIITLGIIGVISVTLIFSIFFYNKFLEHKDEINRLLQAEDVTKNKTNNNDKQYSLINEYKKYKNNKKGKNFITDIENIDIENTQQVLDMQEDTNIDDDVILLAKLINSEAGDEPFDGKIAVANVVLYRSQEKKESMKNIIYASSQFDGVNTKLFSDYPSNESISAAQQALSGKKIIDGGFYFANLELCSPSWAKEKKFICRIGDHWFFEK